MYDNASRVIDVDIDEILPNRFQPRIQFDEEEILELSDSIKEHGVIQPIVVRTIGDKYEIIAGERRYKASVLAGKETVPVIVKNLNDKDSAEIALIENVQRKNLTPIEEALSYKKILDMGYLTQESLAAKLGKSQSSIANKIRLLNLSDEVQEALLENKISERHARSLLRLQTSKEQNDMLNRIITERMTVRKTDEEIAKLKENNEFLEPQKNIEKIKEEGEINMNNNDTNIFLTPNVQQNTQPTFDIFGSNQQPEQNSNFDIFGSNQQPQVTPEINQIPTAAPQVQNVHQFEPQFNLNQNVVTPVQQAPVIGTTPLPEMGGIQFDPNQNISSTSVAPQISPLPEVSTPEIKMPEVNPLPEIKIPEVPSAQPTSTIDSFSPIIDTPAEQPAQPTFELPNQMAQQSENLFSFGNEMTEVPSIQPEVSTPETKMPEPIIITDYSKQYDPVMPQQMETVAPQVEFKEVINAIRECSRKIEQYGFKIDVEEYDLANLYQVIFKVEK